MSQPDLEPPFANQLAPIAREISSGIDELMLNNSILPEVERVTDHVSQLRRTYGSSYLRHETADAVVKEMLFPSQTIAYMLLQPNNPFRRWADRDKRYLLDRALGMEIIHQLSWAERDRSNKTYYPRTGRDPELNEARIARIRSLQARLSERATPTPSYMRS